MLDFGKIIIYTSNLRIIPAPHRRREKERERESEEREAALDQKEGKGEEAGEASKGHSHRRRGKHRTKCGHGNKEMTSPKHKVDMAAMTGICQQSCIKTSPHPKYSFMFSTFYSILFSGCGFQ